MHRSILLLGVSFSAMAQSQTPVLTDANQTTVGYVIDALPGSLAGIVSPSGYTFAADMLTGVISDTRFTLAGGLAAPATNSQMLYFGTTDCSGPAYFAAPSVAGGFLIRYSQGQIYMAPKNEVPMTRQTPRRKVTASATCELWGGSALTVPALPNDPAVTGVPNGGFVGPLGMVDFGTWNGLFTNGFETPS